LSAYRDDPTIYSLTKIYKPSQLRYYADTAFLNICKQYRKEIISVSRNSVSHQDLVIPAGVSGACYEATACR
jgi:hypothetical protein